jgi:hypothetical protein
MVTMIRIRDLLSRATQRKLAVNQSELSIRGVVGPIDQNATVLYARLHQRLEVEIRIGAARIEVLDPRSRSSDAQNLRLGALLSG